MALTLFPVLFALRSLGLLVRKIKEGSVEDVAGKLAEKLTAQGKKNVNRDTASIGLKEVIREVGSAHPMAPVIARVVTPKMLTGLQSTVRGRQWSAHCCRRTSMVHDQAKRPSCKLCHLVRTEGTIGMAFPPCVGSSHTV